MNIFYHVYVKIINMISQKSHSLKLFLWKNIFVVGAGFCATFLSLSINTNKASALFVPTLSASVNQTNLQVNGNQVMNSIDKTTEILFSFRVKTNNRTGYTATLSSETENTALTNTTSTANAKINSISTNLSLNNFPNNTWGYKFWTSSSYAPIPALSSPAQILQTTGETSGAYTNLFSIGMKLADNLESGNYTNKLILSFVSNPYTMRAIMTEGPDFNKKLISLETATNKIEHFKKSPVAPPTSINAVNIDDEESDYEIKLWLDPTDKTAYYYAEPEKVYLNTNSSNMFYSKYNEQKIKNMRALDLSSFDTSKVTNMGWMFNGATNLTTLNLSSFDTSKVTNMKYMFSYVPNLTTLDLSSFDTSKVTDMSDMFSHMFNLTSLDISNFDTSNVIKTNRMFLLSDGYEYNDKLEKIYVNNDFNTSKLAEFSDMFRNRKKLRGGNGSYLADPSTADKTWLRVDRPGVQGYFTRKP